LPAADRKPEITQGPTIAKVKTNAICADKGGMASGIGALSDRFDRKT
jgi:hypothetical protein